MDIKGGMIQEFLDLQSRVVGGQQQLAQAGMREAREVEDFMAQLESWVGYYTVYRSIGWEVRDHQMEAYSGCFYYGVPQSWCRHWRTKDEDRGRFAQGSGSGCQYRDTMIRIAGRLTGRDINQARRVLGWMIQEVGYEEGGEPADWVGRLVRWGGMQVS